MKECMTKIDTRKLSKKLSRARVACVAAIEQGDPAAVARFTCEAARLRNWIILADHLDLEAA